MYSDDDYSFLLHRVFAISVDRDRPFGAISVENSAGRDDTKKETSVTSHNRTEPSQLIMATIMALCVGLASAQQGPRITASGNNLNVATGYGQGQLSVDGVSSFPPGLARVICHPPSLFTRNSDPVLCWCCRRLHSLMPVALPFVAAVIGLCDMMTARSWLVRVAARLSSDCFERVRSRGTCQRQTCAFAFVALSPRATLHEHVQPPKCRPPPLSTPISEPRPHLCGFSTRNSGIRLLQHAMLLADAVRELG
jgi:hypothetical protein